MDDSSLVDEMREPSLKRSNLPPLPLELWTRVIASITDRNELPGIWLTTRRVSHALKAATEAAFVQRHLRDLDIQYLLGFAYIDDGIEGDDDLSTGRKCSLAVNCRFDRLAADGEYAVFKDKAFQRDGRDGDKFFQQARRATRNAWREAISMYLGDGVVDRRFDLPPHVISFGREVLDTDLPGLKADFEAFEISFKWKEALSLFFGEMLFVRHISWLEVHEERRDEVELLRERFERGEISFSAIMMNGMSMLENIGNKVQQSVRRLRFRRWYARHGSPLPDDFFADEEYEEREKLRQLREVRMAAEWADEADEGEDDERQQRDTTGINTWPAEGPMHPLLDKLDLGLDFDAYYDVEENQTTQEERAAGVNKIAKLPKSMTDFEAALLAQSRERQDILDDV